MLRLLCAVVFVTMALPSPVLARSSQMTLSDLRVLCSSGEPSEACRFYILGVMEGTGLASGVAKDTAHFCTPEGVSQTEIVAIINRLAAADIASFPEDADIPAVSFVGAALLKTYPCATR